jgi:hypothetical protein
MRAGSMEGRPLHGRLRPKAPRPRRKRIFKRGPWRRFSIGYCVIWATISFKASGMDLE